MNWISRRELLERSGLGFGALAFRYLSYFESVPAGAAEAPSGFDLTPKPFHHTPSATAVIQLVQNGGPSQMDLFDPKPELQKNDGKRYQEKVEILQPAKNWALCCDGRTDRLPYNPHIPGVNFCALRFQPKL